MTRFEKERAAFLMRYCYISAGKPSSSFINFYLNSFRFESTLEEEVFRNYKEIILKENKHGKGMQQLKSI